VSYAITGKAIRNGIPYSGERATDAPSSMPHVVADTTIDAHPAAKIVTYIPAFPSAIVLPITYVAYVVNELIIAMFKRLRPSTVTPHRQREMLTRSGLSLILRL